MKEISTKWPKIITCLSAIGITMYIVTSLQQGVFCWNTFLIKLVTYGFWSVAFWAIWLLVYLAFRDKKQVTCQAKTAKVKWLAFASLAVVLTALIVVHFLKTPAATRANRIDFAPIEQNMDLSTSQTRLASHIPSLEETVRNESKDIKSTQVIKKQVSYRTLTNVKGVLVVVGTGDKSLLDKDKVKTDVELKLRYAGINVLSEEQYYKTKGRPYLYLKAGVVPDSSSHSFIGCAWSIELFEQVYLERNPCVLLHIATWEDSITEASYGVDVKTVEREVRESVKSSVECFIDDYKFVNPALPNVLKMQEVNFTEDSDGDEYSNVALIGLKGIHVPQLYGSVISVDNDVIPQLEKAGIKVLSTDQWNDVQDGDYHKTPYLYLKAVHGSNAETLKIIYPLQLIDRVILVRNPNIIRELPVWESKTEMEVGDMKPKDEVIREIRQNVQDMVDEFINAYLSTK